MSPSSQRTALVTGAGRGIGKAIAIKLAANGFRVAVNDLDAMAAESVCMDIVQAKGNAFSLIGDITKAASVKAMIGILCQQDAMPTVLVNNAGIISTADILHTDEAEWDKVMAVNLKGVFLTSKAVLPHMQAAGYGKIINIASVAAFLGGGLLGNACYAAAKAGVIAFTKAIAREAGPFGVRANAITPALTDTDMTSGLDPQKRTSIIAQIPLRRAGLPIDVANAVAFLASPDADFISGETLVVDGGFMRR